MEIWTCDLSVDIQHSNHLATTLIRLWYRPWKVRFHAIRDMASSAWVKFYKFTKCRPTPQTTSLTLSHHWLEPGDVYVSNSWSIRPEMSRITLSLCAMVCLLVTSDWLVPMTSCMLVDVVTNYDSAMTSKDPQVGVKHDPTVKIIVTRTRLRPGFPN